MSKRARYTGNGPTTVHWPAGEVYPTYTATIEPNHELPADAPAALRDELLKRDDFTEVNRAEGGSSSQGSSASTTDARKEG